MKVHERLRLEQQKKRDRDIHVGEATICSGGIEDEHGRWVHGWFLPGGQFTTSKLRATTVAAELSKIMQRGTP